MSAFRFRRPASFKMHGLKDKGSRVRHPGDGVAVSPTVVRIVSAAGLLLLCGLLIPGANAQTIASGVWKASKSPYIIESDIVVPAGSTLIIQPGVQVRFSGHFRFTINGLLVAAGTADSMIVFTRHYALEKYNWWGLRFVDADSGSRLEYCLIEYGTTDYPDYNGGGIYCLRSSPSILHCLIQKNHAYSYGGGIYCETSSPIIDGNTILNNTSGLSGDLFTAMDGSGGGIYLKDSSPRVTHNVLMKNKAGFIGSIFGGSGGGLSVVGSSAPQVVNNLFRDNSAIEDDGGGVYCRSPQAVFYNNLFYDNLASGILGGAGGLYADSLTTVKNCIFIGNKWILPDIGEFDEQISDHANITFSNIQGGYPGEGNTDVDPMFFDAAQGDFHLSSGSPCVDAGDPDPRFNDVDGSRNDMGLYGGPGGEVTTEVEWRNENSPASPAFFELFSNFPNPFNLSTVWTYHLSRPGRVTLEIVNCLGERTALLEDEYQIGGIHSVLWRADGSASGVYYAVLRFEGSVSVGKCILLK